MDQSAFRWPYISLCALASVLTFLLGEFFRKSGGAWAGTTALLICTAQVVTVYFMMKRRNREFLYPFLVAPLIVTLFTGVPPLLDLVGQKPSTELITQCIVGAGAIIFAFVLIRRTSVRRDFGLEFNANTTVLVVVFFAIVLLLSR